jgi:hypothetical protein
MYPPSPCPVAPDALPPTNVVGDSDSDMRTSREAEADADWVRRGDFSGRPDESDCICAWVAYAVPCEWDWPGATRAEVARGDAAAE